MKILHIAHYDLYPRNNQTFIGKAKNGLERWLDSMILNSDASYEHYVLYFNHYDQSISLQRILKTGQSAEYTNFFHIEYTEETLRDVFEQVLAWFGPQLIHIHYLQPYTKILPKILNELQYDNIMATMHDESFLGADFGYNNEYYYDEAVADFFSRLKKVVFLHDVSMNRYLSLYQDVLPAKRIVKVPNGITLERIARVNAQERPFTVLFLGSFVENKGSQIIADFAMLAEEQKVALNIFLLGKSNQALSSIMYMGTYNQRNIDEKIALVNPDVIIIPSIVEETYPYTALEATALGYPIVAFNVGALTTIEAEKRGFIVFDKNATALLKKVLEIADLKKNEFAMWVQLFATIADSPNFSEREMVAQYEKIYREIGRRRNSTLDMTAIFQQNLGNLKFKEQQLFAVSQAYTASLEQQKELLQQRGQQRENMGERLIKMLARTKNYVIKHGGFFKSIAYFHSMVKLYGFHDVIQKIIHGKEDLTYSEWIAQHERVYTINEVTDMLDMMPYQPKISLLVPVYNVPEVYLRAVIDSILAQSYVNWELCLADDASSEEHVQRVLKEYMQRDERIKVVFREANGHISAATNSALTLATGEFVGFVDNDDLLVQDALLEVIKVLNEHPDADFIYSDEDKINDAGTERTEPFFKPDWSPDAFWSHMYTPHFNVYRTSIARAIGGLRLGYEGAQDYDFVLRFVEKTNKIYHIPKILYHWRMIETSTASAGGNKDYAYDASIRAKEDALKRRGLKGKVEPLADQRGTNVVFEPRAKDFVSIIIPTKNHAADVELCLDSIYQRSTWRNFEVILIDNNSDDVADIEKFTAFATKYPNLTVLKQPIPFNYSKLNNEGAKIAKGNLLLFLNNDTEVITPDWLERMIGQAILPHTGIVGAKLLYKDNTVQHAGVIMRGEEPVHAFLGLKEDELGYFGRAALNYNYLAVTGAAMMVEKRIFDEVGGFDEDLPVAYNDVEFGIRVYDAGYYNVMRNDVKLYHFESKTRGYDHDSEEKLLRLQHERELLIKKWPRYLANDPFYNRNLTDTGIYFSLRT